MDSCHLGPGTGSSWVGHPLPSDGGQEAWLHWIYSLLPGDKQCIWPHADQETNQHTWQASFPFPLGRGVSPLFLIIETNEAN